MQLEHWGKQNQQPHACYHAHEANDVSHCFSLEHNNLNVQEDNSSNDEKRCSAQKLLFFC